MEHMQEGEKIIKVNIENQMKAAYIDYSMSVIVSRALPDVRDGLKPVHRRVLFGMHDMGVLSNRPYKKSARIVGDVLGKYHPHGDSSVYDAMVRMAQDWSLRYPLVDGQGNFGSIDGDSPAAMRYTEARLKKVSEDILTDIEKGTVDFQLNFDDSLKEPTVLPTRIPNLLVNGASGIAVGMATNMPPHNLSQVIDGTIAYIDDDCIDIPALMKYIKAPDFPTGGIIVGYEGVKNAFETGRGRIVLRGETTIEPIGHGKECIIATSVPYQVNKAEMIKKTAELVNDKKIEGIVDIRDESDRNGMRVVYELKAGTNSNVVQNKLFQYTQLQTSFSVNNIALVNGRPQLLNLKELIKYFVEHRHDVVTRRTQYELNEAEKKAHILQGLIIAIDHLDEVIRLIRASKNGDEAKTGLVTEFSLSEIQAKAILDMRLQKLTGLERDKLRLDYEDILKQIEWLKQILSEKQLRMDIIKEELLEIKEQYGDEPKTSITYSSEDFKIEDMIPDEETIVTISRLGYIKRTPLAEYRRQHRGGVGSRASNTREEDFIEHVLFGTLHNYMLFFTEKGRCFWLRAFEVPEGTKTSKGRAIQNLINIDADDKIRAYINIKDLKDKEYVQNHFVVLGTKNGIIKKTKLEAYSRPRSLGINAISIKEGDRLIDAKLTDGTNSIMLGLKSGKSIRFEESQVRPMGRTAAGVIGIRMSRQNDEVVGMICIPDSEKEKYDILVVSENGYGKRSDQCEYRLQHRGGAGLKTLNVTDKTGQLIAIKDVTDSDDLIIINKSGILIRMAAKDLRTIGRNTQGVRLIRLHDGDAIASITKVEGGNIPSEIDEENIEE
ncbi:MAG: DNA gyrase subunit A [Hyphomicrobiales bacterium]